MITHYININRTAVSQLILNATFSEPSMCNESCNCSQTVGIRILETNEQDESNRVNTSSYSKELATLEYMNGTIIVPINISYGGLYLAVVDTPPGACMTITRLVLYYYVCPDLVINGLKYPETVAPAFNSFVSVEVAVECVGNAVLTDPGGKVQCNPTGKWSPTDITCNCDKGYYLLNNTCEGKGGQASLKHILHDLTMYNVWAVYGRTRF